jgi:hypothetical protein
MAQHRKNLDKLEERKAMYGLNAPLEILNAIDQEKAEIARIEALLAGREVPTSAPSPAVSPPSPTVVHGDVVYGDKVGGDAVGGDKITVGDITGGTGIAIGRGAQATVTQGLGGDEIARLFADIYQRIETRPEDPDVDKKELTGTVQKIQKEAAKGEQANPNRIELLLKTLALMASDIFDVTVACLTSPVAGVATVIRKVAEKAKEKARQA